jgi:DNA-binding transcriptional LysR family regulator
MNLNLRQIDLNLLLVFDALMQEQNLSRAAERLHMSQPAVSNALSRLRLQLNEPLFVRTARGMSPTPRAHALHASVKQGLQWLQQGINPHESFDPAAAQQVFTLAMNDYAQSGLLPPLLTHLQHVAPHVTLIVENDDATHLPARLTTGLVDLAVDYLYFDDPELCYQPLQEETLAVIGCQHHPAFAGGLTLERYQAARHVSIPPRAGRGSPLEIVLGSARVQRQVQLYVPHYITIPSIVANSDLLGTVPQRLADYFAAQFPLAVAPLPIPIPPVQVSLIWHRQQNLTPGLSWLREQITALVGGDSASR